MKHKFLGITNEFMQRRNVSQIIINPDYVIGVDNHDLGLIEVESSFSWSRGVAPACLPLLYP